MESANESINDGEGFIANIATGDTPFMTGELNYGDVEADVYNGGFTNSGWNLLGNPYASPIDLDDFFTENDGVLDQSAYIRIATGFPTLWQGTAKGEMLQISGMDEVSESQIVPLSLWAEFGGKHTFTATEMKGLENMDVMLL